MDIDSLFDQGCDQLERQYGENNFNAEYTFEDNVWIFTVFIPQDKPFHIPKLWQDAVSRKNNNIQIVRQDLEV